MPVEVGEDRRVVIGDDSRYIQKRGPRGRAFLRPDVVRCAVHPPPLARRPLLRKEMNEGMYFKSKCGLSRTGITRARSLQRGQRR